MSWHIEWGQLVEVELAPMVRAACDCAGNYGAACDSSLGEYGQHQYLRRVVFVCFFLLSDYVEIGLRQP